METVRVFHFLITWLLHKLSLQLQTSNLRGYAKENGYQYLAFGRFPANSRQGKISRFSGVF